MLFNSYPFVFVFLPLALAGFAVLARWRTRRAVLAFLIVASLRAIVTYNLLATIYLARLGLGGELTGTLLWPAVALHAAMAFLLARAWFRLPGSVEME